MFIYAFVFAGNPGHFQINDFLLFLAPLFLLKYYLLKLFKKKKSGGGGKLPSIARSSRLASKFPLPPPPPI